LTARLTALGLTLACAAGCASAVREPPPVAAIGGPLGPEAGRPDGLEGLLAEAEAAFAGRPDPGHVARARELFLAGARQDDGRVEGLLGAMRVTAWLVEHEADGQRREALAREAVQLGQWCGRRAPEEVECDYRLALALGQQARERPATAHDGLERMVALLERAAAAIPDVDGAGPDRVLALVRLRAPGWPAGPGDPEAALDNARRAAARAPEEALNQLALGEALAANGQAGAAREAYRRAEALAQARGPDPDAMEWRREAERALERLR